MTNLNIVKTNNTQDALLDAIAKEHLHIETLETQSMNSLDFHDCAVWCLKDALKAAYDAGVTSASQV